MSIKMVLGDATRPLHVIHHTTATYVANNDGEFDIEAAHVLDMQKLGLITKEQAEFSKRLAALAPAGKTAGSSRYSP